MVEKQRNTRLVESIFINEIVINLFVDKMGFENAVEFDRWWGRNGNIFETEALAIEEVLPESRSDAIVIGNGTGKFALRLGLPFGIDPSEEMCELARKKGIDARQGTAEDVPYADEQFSLVLMIGVVSYVNDLEKSFREAFRILKPDGKIVVAFVAKGRKFAELYERAAGRGEYPEGESPEFPYPIEFAKEANWRSVEEVIDHLHECGFLALETVQTLTSEPKNANDMVELPFPDYDRGSWIVIKGTKKSLE